MQQKAFDFVAWLNNDSRDSNEKRTLLAKKWRSGICAYSSASPLQGAKELQYRNNEEEKPGRSMHLFCE